MKAVSVLIKDLEKDLVGDRIQARLSGPWMQNRARNAVWNALGLKIWTRVQNSVWHWTWESVWWLDLRGW